ncbi:UDP-glucosyltransferase 2-like [Megachile rotundata]|uniref:UDP-glucosyltransferase 2-like n=1 Tax=Megachile rotundata TaxID=143995 RepID=UPI003FD1CC4F
MDELSRIRNLVIPCFALFMVLGNQVACERILIIAQAPFYSHVSVIRELSLALNKRGHEIVMVTPHPTKNLPANYTEIDFSSSLKMPELLSVLSRLFGYQAATRLESYLVIYDYLQIYTKYFYEHPDIKRIYAEDSKERFDLVIAEHVLTHGICFIAHKLKAPLITILSVEINLVHHHILGNHLLPSHPSNWEFHDSTGLEVPFWVRVKNFVHALLLVRQWYYYETGSIYDIVKEYLGSNIPSPFDVLKNISLILVNYDPVLTYARPMPFNFVGYSNWTVVDNPPPLPKDILEFLGTASEGFIYMNLGSTINSTMLPAKTLTAISNVFSRLPYKIIWKFETNLPKKSGNIFIRDWIPQQSVLAHKNIKLFIYQGGLQSTEETIHYGVPIIGIPLIFDQLYRIKKLMSLGVGRMLDFTELDEETFQEAVIDVLNNKRYKTKMLELRHLAKDKPYNSKDRAIWWVEYVLRHKGAPHLRFSGADDPWYQRYDMDIVAFLSIMFFIVTVICIITLLRTLQWCFRYYKSYESKHPSSDQKRSKIE